MDSNLVGTLLGMTAAARVDSASKLFSELLIARVPFLNPFLINFVRLYSERKRLICQSKNPKILQLFSKTRIAKDLQPQDFLVSLPTKILLRRYFRIYAIPFVHRLRPDFTVHRNSRLRLQPIQKLLDIRGRGQD